MPWLYGPEKTRWHQFHRVPPNGRVAKLPTQHVKTLNPHLDHAAFDALYTTEHTALTSEILVSGKICVLK